MRKLMVVSAIALVVMAVGTASYAEQWPDTPWTLVPPDSLAFDVTLTAYNNAEADANGFFNYQWDVTVLNGPFHCLTDTGVVAEIEGFRGFSFATPNSLNMCMSNGGSYVGYDVPWTALDWKFLPNNPKLANKNVGTWTGHDVIPVGVPGHFVAGLKSQTAVFDPAEVYDVLVHVSAKTPANQVVTGFVGWNTGNIVTSDEDPPETTPELSSSALLLLGALPIGFAWLRRRKH